MYLLGIRSRLVTVINDAFLVERAEGVLTLTFDRPDAGNAMPPEAAERLIALFGSVNNDGTTRALLVRGNGRNFSAGGDVHVFAKSVDQPIDERRADWLTRQDRLIALVEAYMAVEVPVVAACQGGVVGAGLMYALGADFVVADETVTFAFAHQRLGLTPDGGVSVLLPRAVGERQAAALVLTAARVGADEALRLGLVHRLVAAGDLSDKARAQALRFAKAPARVVRKAKAMMTQGGATAAMLLRERDAIVESVCDPDFGEGVRAFLEKRDPSFQ